MAKGPPHFLLAAIEKLRIEFDVERLKICKELDDIDQAVSELSQQAMDTEDQCREKRCAISQLRRRYEDVQHRKQKVFAECKERVGNLKCLVADEEKENPRIVESLEFLSSFCGRTC